MLKIWYGYFSQFAPYLKDSKFAQEIWKLFEDSELRPDTIPTGEFQENTTKADVDSVMQEI